MRAREIRQSRSDVPDLVLVVGDDFVSDHRVVLSTISLRAAISFVLNGRPR